MNGRSVLRFDGTQGIGIPAADSPVSGQANYTVAVVFRTTTDGTGTSTFRWDRTTGLVSSKATTWYAEDFAIAMGTEGTVGGFYGDRNGNSQQIWDRRPFRLHDGLPHVAVMAVTAEKKMWFMIDGRLHTATFTTGGGTARASRNVLIGAHAEGLGYFTGDIAAVRLYPQALTSDIRRFAVLVHPWRRPSHRRREVPRLLPLCRRIDARRGYTGGERGGPSGRGRDVALLARRDAAVDAFLPVACFRGDRGGRIRLGRRVVDSVARDAGPIRSRSCRAGNRLHAEGIEQRHDDHVRFRHGRTSDGDADGPADHPSITCRSHVTNESGGAATGGPRSRAAAFWATKSEFQK